MSYARIASIAGGACLPLLIAPPSWAQQLKDAGWGDPFFAPYVSHALPAPRSSTGSAAAPVPGSAVAFSLPVFGLPGLGEAAPAVDASPPLPLRKAVASWPGCAAAKPQITTVPETPAQAAGLQPGTWYVRTFDFGCLEVVVEGDRNSPDPKAAGDRAPEVGESGSVDIDYFDENAETEVDAQGETVAGNGDAAAALPDKGTPVIAYTRGNLTYSITVTCSTAESRAFCNDERGLRDLVAQFTPVAGQPR